MERAFIIGCGYTGKALTRRLLAAGIPVVGTTLSCPDTEAGMIQADLQGIAPLDFAAAAGAVVYYMVPTLSRTYDERGRPHLPPMERALSALRPVTPAGLIYLSSTSVYGDRDGGWVDEETLPAPTAPWGRMRLELEQLARAFGQERGIPACVVRLPEIYGPGRGPVARLRRGYTLRFPDRFSNRIHLEDLIEVLTLLGHRLEPDLLLATDDLPAKSVEIYTAAAHLLGIAPPATGTEGPLDPNRLALLRDSKRCCNARLRQWLGRPLHHPTFREGLPTTLDVPTLPAKE